MAAPSQQPPGIQPPDLQDPPQDKEPQAPVPRGLIQGLSFDECRSYLCDMLDGMLESMEDKELSNEDAAAVFRKQLETLVLVVMATEPIEGLADLYANLHNAALRPAMIRLQVANTVVHEKFGFQVIDFAGANKSFRPYDMAEGVPVECPEGTRSAAQWLLTLPFEFHDSYDQRYAQCEALVAKVRDYKTEFPDGHQPAKPGNDDDDDEPMIDAPLPHPQDPQQNSQQDSQQDSQQAKPNTAGKRTNKGKGKVVDVAAHQRGPPPPKAPPLTTVVLNKHADRLICAGFTIQNMVDVANRAMEGREWVPLTRLRTTDLLAALFSPDTCQEVLTLANELVLSWDAQVNGGDNLAAFSPSDMAQWSALDRWMPKQKFFQAQMNFTIAKSRTKSDLIMEQIAKINIMESWSNLVAELKEAQKTGTAPEYRTWRAEVQEAYRWVYNDPNMVREDSDAPDAIEHDVVHWAIWRKTKFGKAKGLGVPQDVKLLKTDMQNTLKDADALRALTTEFGNGVLWVVAVLIGPGAKHPFGNLHAKAITQAVKAIGAANPDVSHVFNRLKILGTGQGLPPGVAGHRLSYEPTYQIHANQGLPLTIPVGDIYSGLRRDDSQGWGV